MRRLEVFCGGDGTVDVALVDDEGVEVETFRYSAVDARWLGAQLQAAAAESESDNPYPRPYSWSGKHA